ncbi:hypothetical protein [Phosphitispora sp. TUW77]|uniref:hypothetical protein n=1 Tax=Phosphitispora sp. TUW77 TaxID=3152361 RepID=UPI003AB3F5FA
MKIAMFSFVCACYIFSDLIPLYNAKEWKTFWTYLIMVILAFSIWVMISMEVDIPSPAMLIRKAVTAIFNL